MDILSFHGRATRMDFWMVSIGLTLLQMVIMLLGGLVIGMMVRDWLTPEQNAVAPAWYALIIHLLFLWPITAVAIRRSHDRNMSGWWYGAYALFGLGLVLVDVVLRLFGIPVSETEIMVSDVVALVQIAVALLFLVILGFLPGARRENRFGPAPNSRHENYRAPVID